MKAVRYALCLSVLLFGLSQAAVSVREDVQITLTRSGTSVVTFPSWEACRAEVIRLANADARTTGSVTYSCQTERRRVVATYSADPPPPPPAPGRVTLSWTPPTQNTDGSTLTNLAGYRIHYGSSPQALTGVIDVPNPGLRTYTVENVPAGTYYIAMRAYTPNAESALSNVAMKVVR